LASPSVETPTAPTDLVATPSAEPSPVEPSPEPVEENHSDHCLHGYEPDPADATMAEGYALYEKNGQIDTTVQPEVIEWMERHEWQAAHFQWHEIRRCGGFGLGGGELDICSYTDLVPIDQECQSVGDGYQFLVMHRHMIQTLKQLWPNHTEQFRGWETFPRSSEDVPEEWRDTWSDWPQSVLAAADIADNIADHLDDFPTEGDFGQWLQCQVPQGFSGLHGELHFKMVRTQNTDHGVGNPERNLDNHIFWLLHGWIDNVWERYRVAKGLDPDEPALRDALIAQCREMDTLAAIINPELEVPDDEPVGEESGLFHETVRPILEGEVGRCSGCHGNSGEAGLTLGGDSSSAEIVAGLVNQPSRYAVGYQLVVPGDPESSWLYLKASGLTDGVQCQGTGSCAQRMPPSSSGTTTLGETELAAIRNWIEQGAPAD
jgi:hypothetical protein